MAMQPDHRQLTLKEFIVKLEEDRIESNSTTLYTLSQYEVAKRLNRIFVKDMN